MVFTWECDGNTFEEKGMIEDSLPEGFAYKQSHKNPVSASAMLTGKFLQIRKVFATRSLLAEESPDTLQYKIFR